MDAFQSHAENLGSSFGKVKMAGRSLVCAILILVTSWTLPQRPDDKRLFERAMKAFAAENFRAALLDLNSLNQRTGRTDILYYSGYCLLKLGQYRAAVENFEAALEALPESWEARLGLAKAHYHLDESAAARTHIQRVLQKAPENIEALYYDGLLELRSGDRPAALARFEEILARDSFHLGALYNAGQTALRMGRREQARKWLQQHQNVAPRFNRIRSLRKAASFPTSTAYNWLSLGNAYLEVDQYSRALEAYLAAREKDPNLDQVDYYLGYVRYRLQEYDLSIEHYERFLENRPGHFQALFNLGHSYRKLGELESAIQIYQAASQADESTPLPLVAIVEIRMKSGQWVLALELARQINSSFPDYSHGYFLTALCERQRGNWPESRLAVLRAIDLDPDHAAYQTLLKELTAAPRPPSESGPRP